MKININIKAVIRFFTTLSVSLAVGFGVNWFNHKSYYETISRTQSVDLNMLTNTLPTKLSDSLKRRDLIELQRTINSNYGLFGLVVTDCKKSDKDCEFQTIIAISQPARKGWREKSIPENLMQFPYDILRDPPPTTSEWQFKNDKTMAVLPTGRENKGNPIGRVYYIRKDPPDLIQSHKDWIWAPVESFQFLKENGDIEKYYFWEGGANKYYSLTYLLFLVTALLIWRIWQENAYQKKQVIYEQTRLSNLTNQTNRVINNLGNRIQILQGELQKASIDTDNLKTKLIETESLLQQKEKENLALSSRVKNLSNDLDVAKVDRDSYKNQIDLANKNIQDTLLNIQLLEENLRFTEISNAESNQNVEEFQEEISKAYQFIESERQLAGKLEEELEKAKLNYVTIEKKLNDAEIDLSDNKGTIDSLNRELEKQLQEKTSSEELMQQLEIENKSLSDEKLKLETRNKSLEDSWSKNREELRREADKKLDNLCNSLDRDIEEKDNEIKKLKDLIVKREEAVKHLQNCFSQGIENFSEEDTDEDISESAIRIGSVAAALQLASEHFSVLEIWDSVWESVDSINNFQPNKVYKYLEALAEVADLTFNGTLQEGLFIALKRKNVAASPESSQTMREYGKHRNFRHKEKSKQMSNHLKIGRIRIYFEFDNDSRKVQIGYCGKHLPTVTSPT